MAQTVSSRYVIRLHCFVSFGLIIATQWYNTGVSAHLLPYLNIGLGNNRGQGGEEGNNQRIDRTPLINSPLGSLSLITGGKKNPNQNGAINCDPNAPQNSPDRKVIGFNIHIGPHHYPPHQPHYPTAPLLPPECNPHPPGPAEMNQPEPTANLQPVSPPYVAHSPLISSTTTVSIPVSSTTTTPTTNTVSTGFESHSNVVSSTTATNTDVDKLIGDVFGNTNNPNAERNVGNTNTNEQQTNSEITGEGLLDIRMPKSD